MDADGANQAHLTHGTRPKGPASQPQFSPDGKKIVFEGWKQGRVEIYVMDSDGSHIVDLSRSDAVNANPTFSQMAKRSSSTLCARTTASTGSTSWTPPTASP
jgi:Tol biopolymer transport system component